MLLVFAWLITVIVRWEEYSDSIYRDCIQCVDKIIPMVTEFSCKNRFGERLKPL